jgi:hypothetical protein
MTHAFMEPDKAAAYSCVPEAYLMRQIRQGTGPAYFMPSAKKIMFRQQDLDEWIATWERRQRGSTTE